MPTLTYLSNKFSCYCWWEVKHDIKIKQNSQVTSWSYVR